MRVRLGEKHEKNHWNEPNAPEKSAGIELENQIELNVFSFVFVTIFLLYSKISKPRNQRSGRGPLLKATIGAFALPTSKRMSHRRFWQPIYIKVGQILIYMCSFIL